MWKAYPNKKGKSEALKSFIKARKGGTSFEDCERGLIAYNQQIAILKTKPEFIKHGSTWFNNKGWEDEYTTTPNAASVDDSVRDIFAEI